MAYDGYINIDTRISTAEFKTGIEKMQSIVQNGARIMVTALATVTTAVSGIAAAAVTVGSSFEAAMSKVSAISGATGEDLDALTKKAEAMGASTKFSATESAQALQYMAMAGWNTKSMLDGIEGVMNLAAADGLDLATTSDIVTDSLTAFGLSASDSTHFADVLAAASSNANTNVSMLGESFKYAAPLAGTMGYSVEDMALALGLMANASIKGSQAGTYLRTAFANLAKPTKQMKDYMDKLGVSITDTNGNIKPLKTLLSDLREKFSGLSTAEKTAAASAIFGKEAMSGMLAIINASEEDFEKLTNAVDNADGTAKRMADTLQNNLQGQFTILKSSLEGLGIQIYDNIKEPLRDAAESTISSIGEISSALTENGVAGAASALGSIVSDAIAAISENVPKINEIALELINGFCSGIEQNTGQIKVSARKIVQSLVNSIFSMLTSLAESSSEVINVASICIDKFITGIKKNTHRLSSAAKTVVTSLAEGIVRLLPTQLQQPIQKTISTIEKSFNSGGIKKALESFKTALKNVGTAGSNIVAKLINPLAVVIDKLAGQINVIIPLMIAWAATIKTMSIIKAVTGFITGMTAATSAEAIATAASVGTITLKQIAVAALTGKITLATAAQHAWNLAMNANPIGVVITVVIALGAAIGTLKIFTDNQTEAEKGLEQAQARLTDQNKLYAEELENYAVTLSNICEKTVDFQSGIENAGSCLDGFNDSIIMSSDKQQELSDQMNTVQTEITEIARTAAEERRALTQSEIERLEELFAKEKELADRQLQVKQEYQNVVKDMAADLVANEALSIDEYAAYAQQYINTAQTTRDEAIKAAEDYKTNYLAQQRALIDSDKEHTQEWYDSIRKEAEEHYREQVDSANKTCADTLQILSDGYLDKSDALTNYVNKMQYLKDQEELIHKEAEKRNTSLIKEEQEAQLKAQEQYANDYSSNHKLLNEKMQEIEDEYSAKHAESLEREAKEMTALVKERNSAACDDVVQEQLSAWLAMQSNTELYGGKITDKGQKTLDTFVASFDKMDDDMRQQSRQAMEGMLQGFEDREPALYAKADGIANNIISRLRRAFDIHSPSRVTRKIFTQVIDGGIVGTEEEAPKLYKTAENTATSFNKKIKSSLSSSDLVDKMRNAVYASNFPLYTAATRVEHTISQQNEYRGENSLGKIVAQGNIENHLIIDGREAAIVLTPYISEELAFST